MIKEFQGQYRWLSNFFLKSIVVDGVEWPSTEHYYAAQKNLDPEYQERVRNYALPSVAKKIGQATKIRPDWNEVRDGVMLKALRAKFLPGSDLARFLLETGDQELQEGNLWNDTYWGVCLKTGIGQNKLGKMLMQVREELRRGI